VTPRRKPVTAAELMARLNADPAFLERRRQKEAELKAKHERYLAAAEPVLQELRALGYQVESIGDLRRPPVYKYPDAVPVLVRWLPRISDPSVKEDIIRTLSVPWARAAVPTLLEEFERVSDDALRWVVGNALEVLADDTLFEDLASIARDRRYGSARAMVVVGFGRLKDPRAIPILIALLEDDDVAVSAMIALGKLKERSARPLVEKFLTHPDSWVRQEAKKALARIDR